MGQLHADLRRRPAACRGQRLGECDFGGVVVQAEVGPADPPARLDRSGLDDDEARTGQREVGPVLCVPVGGFAVDRGVLAHRRHHDAVGQRQRTDGERRKELAHAIAPMRAATIRCRHRSDNAMRGTLTCRSVHGNVRSSAFARRSCEGRNPASLLSTTQSHWIPAFAGMTASLRPCSSAPPPATHPMP